MCTFNMNGAGIMIFLLAALSNTVACKLSDTHHLHSQCHVVEGAEIHKNL